MNPTNFKKQKGVSSLGTAVLVLLIIVLTGASVYFWQNYEKQKALNTLKAEIQTNIDKTKIGSNTEVPGGGAPSMDYSEPSPTPKPNTPVVIYTPNGVFNPFEIEEITQKFVSPFVDWNNENKVVTVSINIEKPAEPVAGYKYKVTYINEGGSNGGFLYGTTTPLEWWLPECVGGCKFSESFKTKYPEIVAKY